MKKLLLALLILPMMFGCDDDPDPMPPEAPAIEITVNHEWNGSALDLNKWYLTSNADSFSPVTLNYHINHISLIDADGNATMMKEYDMVNYEQDGNTKKFTIDGVEDKVFTKIRFTLGVEDSLVNVNGELNDDFVDPMYWGMAMGYINLKLEGKRMKDGKEGNVYFHIGGYDGADQTARVIELSLNTNLEQTLGANTANLTMNIEQFFHSPNLIDLEVTNDVQVTGSDAVMISENWESMFSID